LALLRQFCATAQNERVSADTFLSELPYDNVMTKIRQGAGVQRTKEYLQEELQKASSILKIKSGGDVLGLFITRMQEITEEFPLNYLA
jgi:hypothetical protein